MWGGNGEKRAFYLVKRDKLMLDKRRGGLGISILKAHNSSLLMKWHLRYEKKMGAYGEGLNTGNKTSGRGPIN